MTALVVNNMRRVALALGYEVRNGFVMAGQGFIVGFQDDELAYEAIHSLRLSTIVRQVSRPEESDAFLAVLEDLTFAWWLDVEMGPLFSTVASEMDMVNVVRVAKGGAFEAWPDGVVGWRRAGALSKKFGSEARTKALLRMEKLGLIEKRPLPGKKAVLRPYFEYRVKPFFARPFEPTESELKTAVSVAYAEVSKRRAKKK